MCPTHWQASIDPAYAGLVAVWCVKVALKFGDCIG